MLVPFKNDYILQTVESITKCGSVTTFDMEYLFIGHETNLVSCLKHYVIHFLSAVADNLREGTIR